MQRTDNRMAQSRLPGVNVIGHITASMGLAVAARNTLAMLLSRGVPVEGVDIDPGGGRQGTDLTYECVLQTPPCAPHAVNLFHLNPPEVLAQVNRRPAWLDLVGRVNAIVPFWELPRLPVVNHWVAVAEMMDLVLAPSRFIADAVQASAPAANVVHYPQAVLLPADVVPSRSAFGLPHDRVLFYLSVDVTSDLMRKNPADALRAFRAAFEPTDPVGLVVKLNHAHTEHAWANSGPLLAELQSLPNTYVIDRSLSYPEVLALCASCDVFVSLHRSEGLGLNLLEAMALGKPVLATGWSGNMDFMTAENSCLVGHDLVPVVANHPAYQPAAIGPGQVWAEPNVTEAVGWMQGLAGDAMLRTNKGAQARASMEAGQRRFLEGGMMADLAAAVDHLAIRPDRAVRTKRWRGYQRMPLGMRAQRWRRRLARTLGFSSSPDA